MRNGVLFATALWVLLGCEFLFAQSRANQSAELSRSAQDSLRSDAEKNAISVTEALIQPLNDGCKFMALAPLIAVILRVEPLKK